MTNSSHDWLASAASSPAWRRRKCKVPTQQFRTSDQPAQIRKLGLGNRLLFQDGPPALAVRWRIVPMQKIEACIPLHLSDCKISSEFSTTFTRGEIQILWKLNYCLRASSSGRASSPTLCTTRALAPNELTNIVDGCIRVTPYCYSLNLREIEASTGCGRELSCVQKWLPAQ